MNAPFRAMKPAKVPLTFTCGSISPAAARMPKRSTWQSLRIQGCRAHGAPTLPRVPLSCDTFVVLPPHTAPGTVVFGKNSDRPTQEVQEVVHVPAAVHLSGSMLRCTYISIPQVPATHGVVLSKPVWMWGAEMGANDAGVVIGNEAVWTREPDDGPPALLGMDLVRLGLERGGSAQEATEHIISLLEAHGQGGPCELEGDWTYHNSFLVADAQEAWVLETAGRWWAVEQIQTGSRNISNCLSIRTSSTRSTPGLQQYASSAGYWSGERPFDWAAAFATGFVPPAGKRAPGRDAAGCKLLEMAAASAELGGFTPQHMMAILRDRLSGICMTGEDGDGYRTNGAQVSLLQADGANVHWFTATPSPDRSIFKPIRLAPEDTIDLGPYVLASSTPQQYPMLNISTPIWRAWATAARIFESGPTRSSWAGTSDGELCGSNGADMTAQQLLHDWRVLKELCEASNSSKPFRAAAEEEMLLYQRAGGCL